MRYTAVDDSGVIINPLLFEGQIHGGLAMGIGQALSEKVEFDPNSGQPLSGSFMDYCMPRGRQGQYFRRISRAPDFLLRQARVPGARPPSRFHRLSFRARG